MLRCSPRKCAGNLRDQVSGEPCWKDSVNLEVQARLGDALSVPIRKLVSATTLLAATVAAYAVLEGVLHYLHLRNSKNEVERVFNLNRHLAEAVSAAVFVCFFFS